MFISHLSPPNPLVFWPESSFIAQGHSSGLSTVGFSLTKPKEGSTCGEHISKRKRLWVCFIWKWPLVPFSYISLNASLIMWSSRIEEESNEIFILRHQNLQAHKRGIFTVGRQRQLWWIVGFSWQKICLSSDEYKTSLFTSNFKILEKVVYVCCCSRRGKIWGGETERETVKFAVL